MKEPGKLRLKKFYIHPITMFLILTGLLMIISFILSLFETQATYNTINVNTNELEPVLVTVENLLSFDGIKFLISDAARNFLSFGPLGTFLLTSIGLTIAEATGFIEMLTRRHISKIHPYVITYLVILVATISSLVNEVGYAILIPLAAMIYFMNNRNPILGIITAFCGVSFGYGVSIFVGSTEIALIDYTRAAAHLIDETFHVSLTSNLFFIVITTFIISLIGTFIIEKLIAPKIGTYKKDEEYAQTEKYHSFDLEEEEQREIEREKYEKRGLRYALIVTIIMGVLTIYALIPKLPLSGMLLDMNEKIYVNQLYGDNSYFQDGFTFLVAAFFAIAGIAYGIGSKSIKNDKDIIERASKNFNNIGSIYILMLVASQFVALFRKSNIGLVVTAWLANLFEKISFSGIPLIIFALVVIALANLLLTSNETKWMILSPVIVPTLMQSNISPQFAQIILRVGDSMTKGFTPLLASFVLYIGYLNVYNLNKKKPFTINKAFRMITPYFYIIFISWTVIVVIWYIIGLPIGPGVVPTI